MTYGFIIDHRKCIGCHACSVACKAENRVPLGVFRTWVKQVEKGEFPQTRRFFTVLRCNHCDNPPCVSICPTQALIKREDGIVDFDNRSCIACRSCMAACPYDALYHDPETGTAAKCHYCAHRIEVGLMPACVSACPEQAIIAGDTSDPEQEISQLLMKEPIRLRRPEKGTKPRVFYIDADESGLLPGEVWRARSYMWSEAPGGEKAEIVQPFNSQVPREVYNVAHERAWGGMISAYLWVKSIAAGAMLVSSLAALSDIFDLFVVQRTTSLAGPILGLVFLVLAAGMVIADLGKRWRFLLVLWQPNRRSWLVWGAYTLILFGLTCIVWCVKVLFFAGTSSPGLAWSVLAISSTLAGFSALLMAQAKARDLWQSPALLPVLLCHALAAGAASHLIVAAIVGFPSEDLLSLFKLMLLATVVGMGITLLELFLPHVNQDLSRICGMILKGKFAKRFWMGSVLATTFLPLILLQWIYFMGVPDPFSFWSACASGLVLAGLLIHQDIWVRAGQSIPLS